MLEGDITKAFVHAYDEQAESLFQNYLDHVEAYVLKRKVTGQNNEEMDPDIKFLESIEQQIGITGTVRWFPSRCYELCNAHFKKKW